MEFVFIVWPGLAVALISIIETNNNSTSYEKQHDGNNENYNLKTTNENTRNSGPTVQASSWTTTLMEFDKGNYF